MPDIKETTQGGLFYTLKKTPRELELQKDAEAWERVARQHAEALSQSQTRAAKAEIEVERLKEDKLTLMSGIFSALQFLKGEALQGPVDAWPIQTLINDLNDEAEDVALARMADKALQEPETWNPFEDEEKTEVEREPVLCFIRGPWAYFTTQPLNMQNGCGWQSDVAYFAVGVDTPHLPQQPDSWKIIKVAFEAPNLALPLEAGLNGVYSVEEINLRKAAPWLQTPAGSQPGETHYYVWAGTTLERFKEIVRKTGGEVYESR
jgi:hypothetical protein